MGDLIYSSFFELLSANSNLRAVLVQDSAQAQIALSIAPYFNRTAYALPDIRASIEDEVSYFQDELNELINTLFKAGEDDLLIIPKATAELGIYPLEKPLKIEFAQRVKGAAKSLANELIKLGYKPCSTVLDATELACNGDKLDVYAPNMNNALRIVFFDDEIESIKEFDVATQLSLEGELECVQIAPLINNLFAKTSLKDALNPANLSPAKKFKDFKPLINQAFFDANKDKNITLLASNDSKLNGLNLGSNVKIVKTSAYFNISDGLNMFISLNQPIKKHKQRRIKLDLNTLKKGDYVVHERYGIGKFIGLELIEQAGFKTECIRLLYAAENMLLLPSTSINLLEPYACSSTPNLDHLGKSTFIKLKEKARTKLMAIAEKIAELAAKRVLIKAPVFKKDLEYEIFKNSAGFELTPDQAKSIDEIINDFSKGYPMDRLLAADVGFGKTEVAMHAAYLCAKAGFRTLFLVPTTLLCAQHYASLKARFEPFNIGVFRLDSTTSKASVLKNLSNEAIIVGTHSILSADIANIGLIIVDEEHKFGVKQKERLKELALKAHFLSMSATPIPRTLSSALSSLKSYSQINTPPNERIGTQSKLAQIDDALIKEIILRELRRGGQVFYIHNRLASLEAKAAYLNNLLPKLKIATLSSETKAADKERILKGFLAQEYDLLLSTSIVESGLDMPRANSIIIERADLFGVADLHQLRGRVGRGDRQGFCYFLIEKDISQTASERLISLASNSYLGAGAALAQMDLELRGGGNLLGAEQSGHIEALGYGLYIKMLEEQLNALSKKSAESSVELKLSINAYLSSDLISDDGIRLEFYRRLANANSSAALGLIEDEFIDRFGQLDSASANYFTLMRIRLLAHNISTISSFNENIKITYLDNSSKLIKAPSAKDSDVLNALLKELHESIK